MAIFSREQALVGVNVKPFKIMLKSAQNQFVQMCHRLMQV
jgi:hypothetical protein